MQKEFARAIGISEEQLRNYFRGIHLPRDLKRIKEALFGHDPTYLPDWQRELEEAFNRTREARAKAPNQASEKSPVPAFSVPTFSTPPYVRRVLPVLNENGATIVGGLGIAQGLVHVAWTVSLFLDEDTGALLRSPWTYADCVFGVGGIVLGLGCLSVQWWARIGGICFCLLALLCAYLWFMDESNNDASRVVFAINLLTPPFALGALFYFLFGWPKDRE